MKFLVNKMPEKPNKCWLSAKLPFGAYTCTCRKGSHPCSEVKKCKILRPIQIDK